MDKACATLLLGTLLGGCQATPPPASVAVLPATSSTTPAVELQQAAPAPPGALGTVLGLIRHSWRLVAATDAGGHRIAVLFAHPDKPLRLDFNASLVSVGGACNVMSAHHAAAADSLEVAPFNSATAPCGDPALAAAGAALAKHLQGRLALRFEAGTPPRLVLVNAEGDTLTFDGTDAPAQR